MTVQHPELRAKAEKATPGPWLTHMMRSLFVGPGRPGNLKHIIHSTENLEDLTLWAAARQARDAEYIAAASPDVILGLLSELDTAEQKIAELAKLHVYDPWYDQTPEGVEVDRGGGCAECKQPGWPCDTARILSGGEQR